MLRLLADEIDRSIHGIDGVADTTVEAAVFGTTDATAIAASLDRWCSDVLGAPVRTALGYHASVGCTALVELADGRRVACKAYQPRWTPPFLAAVHAAQRHVATAGFPAPRPIAGPSPCGAGNATADRWVDAPDAATAAGPGDRGASATALARLVALLRPLDDEPDLQPLAHHPLALPPGRRYPEPHSPIFDFAATAAGAGWIDELADAGVAARDGAGAAPPTIAHTDWSLRNVRIVDGELVMAFDWDSLAMVAETTSVGQAAQTWSATGEPDRPSFPEPASVAAFVRDYEAERGTPFEPAERRAIGGAALANLAYIARCEHSVAHRWPDVDHGAHATAVLRRHGDALLDLDRLI